MSDLDKWILAGLVLFIASAVGAALLISRMVRLNAERRADEAEAMRRKIEDQARSRLRALIPDFMDTAPRPEELASGLGIPVARDPEWLRMVEARLKKQPVTAGLIALRGLLRSSTALAEQANVISEEIGERVNTSRNILENHHQRLMSGRHSPNATERQHYFTGMRKDLDRLEPLWERFKAERESFMAKVRFFLCQTVCELANGTSWNNSHADRWQALVAEAYPVDPAPRSST